MSLDELKAKDKTFDLSQNKMGLTARDKKDSELLAKIEALEARIKILEDEKT